MRQASKKARIIHRCVGCGKEFPHQFITHCDCGHFVDVYYDLSQVTFHRSPNPFERYFDLLPLQDRASLIPFPFERTPCHHAAALGKALGLPHLYLKNETVLPTRSTKDRMAILVISFFRELGIHRFSVSSTGNSSTSFARFIRYHEDGFVTLFAAEDFLNRLNFEEGPQTTVFGLRGATFVEACDVALAYSKRRGEPPERGFFNPARREALKTSFLEAAEDIQTPIDWYVQAVSSGMGVWGTYKGAREMLALKRISRLPRLLCVQQESNPPMVRAFEAGSEVIRPKDIVESPQGIAQAILRGNPSGVYPYIRSIVLDSGGTFAAVSEEQIREARTLVEELEGISPCFTASAAVAGLIQLARRGEIPSTHTVLINLTGADREPAPPPKQIHWLERGDGGWALEDSSDHRGRELWEAS